MVYTRYTRVYHSRLWYNLLMYAKHMALRQVCDLLMHLFINTASVTETLVRNCSMKLVNDKKGMCILQT